MQLTLKQILDASVKRPGETATLEAYFALAKPVAISWANRAQPMAIQSAVIDFQSLRLELCKRHGTLNADKTAYDFGENRRAFDAAIDELLDRTVDIPGVPVAVGDVSGKATEAQVAELVRIGLLFGPDDTHSPK